MKAHVIGFEISEGISKKTGKPYSIGKLYAALPIIGTGAHGLMGSTYQCEPVILRKLENCTLPLYCDLEMQDVMRFGERRQEIASVVPVTEAAPVPRPSAPATRTTTA